MIVRVEAFHRCALPEPDGAREHRRCSDMLAHLVREFPTIEISCAQAVRGDVLEVREEEWRDPTLNLYRFDDVVDEHAKKPTTLRLVGSDAFVAEQGLGVVTRCQRCIDRRNSASRAPLFDAALARLPVLYDCQKPLCRADYRHALDAWQWLLRLERDASLEVQLSVLLHDVERTVSEADRRIEHRAADYAAFKYAHAAAGAELARTWLEGLGASPAVARRAAELIRTHENPGADPESNLINDADALSFFSLNSAGFLDYFGPQHTRRKSGTRSVE